MRAHFTENPEGEKIVTATPRQDSAKLSTLAHANCLLVRVPDASAAAKGQRVEILLLRP